MKTDSKELKRCPFCGGTAEIFMKDWPYAKTAVRCTKCKTETKGFGSAADAVEAWQRRTK